MFLCANTRSFPFLGSNSLKILFTFKGTETEVQRTFTFQRYTARTLLINYHTITILGEYCFKSLNHRSIILVLSLFPQKQV